MKGQLTNEFVLLLFIFILAAIGLTVFAFQKTTEQNDLKQYIKLRDLCSEISTIINLATISNGYRSNFTLPPNIEGANYSVNVHNTSLSITVQNKTCISSLRALQIRNDTSSTPFMLVPGSQYQITNEDWVIIIDS
ncbi:hypothetical protein HY570_00545 [Candidatus Micrarchaeota archaeon]|nr:hypothetical protein [Candidatus Micrarchaeota archaeon]